MLTCVFCKDVLDIFIPILCISVNIYLLLRGYKNLIYSADRVLYGEFGNQIDTCFVCKKLFKKNTNKFSFYIRNIFFRYVEYFLLFCGIESIICIILCAIGVLNSDVIIDVASITIGFLTIFGISTSFIMNSVLKQQDLSVLYMVSGNLFPKLEDSLKRLSVHVYKNGIVIKFPDEYMINTEGNVIYTDTGDINEIFTIRIETKQSLFKLNNGEAFEMYESTISISTIASQVKEHELLFSFPKDQEEYFYRQTQESSKYSLLSTIPLYLKNNNTGAELTATCQIVIEMDNNQNHVRIRIRC